MKWVALLLFLAAIPATMAFIRSNPNRAPWIWGLLGFLPFVIPPWHLAVAPYSFAMWSGYVKGWEVSLLDSIALAIILSGVGRGTRMPLKIPIALYLLAVAVAALQSPFPNYAAGYLIQFLRVVLVCIAVARVCTDERGDRAVLTGLILGIMYQAFYAIMARAGGALQTGGSLGHQNLLGFISHMVVMPAFALLLSGRMRRIALVGTIAGGIVVILTASRATLGLSALGIVLTYVLVTGMRFSTRKAMLGIALVAVMGVSIPIGQASLQRRFDARNEAGFFAVDKEREAFERAAHMMLADHPLGVGPNHYVFVANVGGYSERAGVIWATGSRAANVHNTYLLMAAESGYAGVITLIGLFATAILTAFRSAFRFRRSPRSDVLVGLGVSIFIISIHAFYEWIFVSFTTQYVFGVVLGLIIGIRQKLLNERRAGTQSGLPINRITHPRPTWILGD